MTLINILLVMLILTASFLCIYAIVFLHRISGQIVAIRKDIHRLVENTIPLLNILEEFYERADGIVNKVESSWVKINYSIRYWSEKISKFNLFKKIVTLRYSPNELIKNIRPFAKSVSAFWREYKHT